MSREPEAMRTKLARSARKQGRTIVRRKARKVAKKHPSIPAMILGATVTLLVAFWTVELAVDTLTVAGWVLVTVTAAVVVAVVRMSAARRDVNRHLPSGGGSGCSSACETSTGPREQCTCPSCAGRNHGMHAGARR